MPAGQQGARSRAPAGRVLVAGNANLDLVIGPVDAWPTPGTEVLAERLLWRVGGGLGNAAMALRALGVPTALVWDVGDDAAGRFLGAAIGDAGRPRVLAAPTSVTIGVAHPNGERTFLTHLGHLEHSEIDRLRDAVRDARPGDHLLAVGTFLLPRWRSALPEVLAAARERGVVTALDTGWPTDGWTTASRDAVLATLQHVDLFLPNLDEARGLLDAPSAPPLQVLSHLERTLPGTSVVKLGADGAAYLWEGRVHVEAAPAVAVADTVGAGDTFNAVVMACMAAGWRLTAAVRAAVQTASHTVASDPRRHPGWDEVVRMAGAAAEAAGRR